MKQLKEYITESKLTPEANALSKMLQLVNAKYGSFMINIDRKLWRGTTFDEFYGGGVVD